MLERKQSQKKAKSLFKKWLGIEERLALPGDESGVEMVSARARAWVVAHNSRAAGGAAQQGEDDDKME